MKSEGAQKYLGFWIAGANLKAAKRIGLTIPSNVLVRADKVFR